MRGDDGCWQDATPEATETAFQLWLYDQPSEHAAWSVEGWAPREAFIWSRAGFTCDAATAWAAAVTYTASDLDTEPSSADDWYSHMAARADLASELVTHGLTAADWYELAYISTVPGEIRLWLDRGYTGSEARAWVREAGFETPDSADAWGATAWTKTEVRSLAEVFASSNVVATRETVQAWAATGLDAERTARCVLGMLTPAEAASRVSEDGFDDRLQALIALRAGPRDGAIPGSR